MSSNVSFIPDVLHLCISWHWLSEKFFGFRGLYDYFILLKDQKKIYVCNAGTVDAAGDVGELDGWIWWRGRISLVGRFISPYPKGENLLHVTGSGPLIAGWTSFCHVILLSGAHKPQLLFFHVKYIKLLHTLNTIFFNKYFSYYSHIILNNWTSFWNCLSYLLTVLHYVLLYNYILFCQIYIMIQLLKIFDKLNK